MESEPELFVEAAMNSSKLFYQVIFPSFMSIVPSFDKYILNEVFLCFFCISFDIANDDFQVKPYIQRYRDPFYHRKF